MAHKLPKIVINPIGGLANRMRALASGISLALELASPYEIVWCRNRELNARFEDIFKISPEVKDKVVYPSAIKYNLLYSVPRKQNLFVSAISARSSFGVTLRDYVQPLQNLILHDRYDEIKALVKDSLDNGKDTLIQGGTPFYPYTSGFYRHLFIPVDSIRKRVEEIMTRLGKDSIGIHIRRSDNAQSILHSPDSLFIREIEDALKRNPDVRFYLATDDEPTKSKFKGLYGDRIICSESVADRNSIRGIEDAATEMFALSNTSRIIGSFYSSFSEAAATLGGRPFSQVCEI
ncbi:MAG: hypothetical protein K2K64_05835 [Muribaculaceae bacterium]|nr:hypothetical protein [Muribaculaceae bacterium]